MILRIRALARHLRTLRCKESPVPSPDNHAGADVLLVVYQDRVFEEGKHDYHHGSIELMHVSREIRFRL